MKTTLHLIISFLFASNLVAQSESMAFCVDASKCVVAGKNPVVPFEIPESSPSIIYYLMEMKAMLKGGSEHIINLSAISKGKYKYYLQSGNKYNY